MGEAQIARISRQFLRKLAVAQPAAVLLRSAPPRAEMHFVDRNRRAQRVDAGGRRLRPRDRVAGPPRSKPVCGRSSAANASGSDFSGSMRPSGPMISYLYLSPALGFRHEDFPESVAAHPHGVAPAVPQIEIADHADPPALSGANTANATPATRRRGPWDGRRASRRDACASLRPAGRDRDRTGSAETDRVFDLDLPLRRSARARGSGASPLAKPALEQAGVMNALEAAFVALLVDDGDALRVRKEDADDRDVTLDDAGRDSGRGRNGDPR